MFCRVVSVILFTVLFSNLVISTPIRQESSEIQGIEKSLAFDIGAPAKEDKADQSEGKVGSIWRLGKRQSGFGNSLAEKLEKFKAQKAAEKPSLIPLPAATVDPKVKLPAIPNKSEKLGTTLIDKTGTLGQNLGDDGEAELEKERKKKFRATLKKILKNKGSSDEFEAPPGFYEKEKKPEVKTEEKKREEVKIKNLVDSDKTVEVPENKEIVVVDNETGNGTKLEKTKSPNLAESSLESRVKEILKKEEIPAKVDEIIPIARSESWGTETPKIGQETEAPKKLETPPVLPLNTEPKPTQKATVPEVEKNPWSAFLDQLLQNTKRSTETAPGQQGQRPGFSFSLFF
ncbi:unnamed protein product [Bursaphelenchus xylophilus]|uniref:(pine wood nematode) hypothetical protein n=1 Tax=Bursaphelenchus xylophilus TaxID=6326 RepID=A0A7I8WY54_BURXY|nr:unnamed protein product [Bursaphelenchus xylophilus]CAG9101059.1 unnamed protein product [Bursaphelenchus xylophilus]